MDSDSSFHIKTHCYKFIASYKIAASECGHDPVGWGNLSNIPSRVNFGPDCNGVSSVTSDGLLTDLLCCNNFDEGEEFVQLFTSDPTPPVSSSYENEGALPTDDHTSTVRMCRAGRDLGSHGDTG